MLLFQPLESAVDATFWSALGDLKLDTLGLSEEALKCHGASPHAPFAACQPCAIAVSNPKCAKPVNLRTKRLFTAMAGWYSASSHAELAARLNLDLASLESDPPQRPVSALPAR